MDERLGKAQNIRSSASPFLRCISMWGWTLWQLRWNRVKWHIKAHSCPLSEPTKISQLKLRRTFWAERKGQIWTVPSEAQEISNSKSRNLQVRTFQGWPEKFWRNWWFHFQQSWKLGGTLRVWASMWLLLWAGRPWTLTLWWMRPLRLEKMEVSWLLIIVYY